MRLRLCMFTLAFGGATAGQSIASAKTLCFPHVHSLYSQVLRLTHSSILEGVLSHRS